MFFGSDWLANLYMGCFLFGLIFTSLSLFLTLGHFGGDASTGHGPGHLIHGAGHAAHGPHAGTHGAHTADAHGHTHAATSDQLEGLSPINLPTLLAFLTWFGGAGYILHVTFGLSGVFATVLALFSGLIGGAIVFLVL